MKKCKFLIGWFDGSDGACGDNTGIKTPDDLIRLHSEGSEHVSCFKYEAPEGFEWEVGAAQAFKENFTAHDSVSRVLTADDFAER